MLIGASAAVGIYRNQRSAQVFSKPLFEPVAPTEVITASEIIGKTLTPTAIVNPPVREAVPASDVAFQPEVLAATISRTLQVRRAFSRDELRQLRALFALAPTAPLASKQSVAAARVAVLDALLEATRDRVGGFLLDDAASLLATFDGIKTLKARQIKTRINDAMARVGKLARAEQLLQALPLSRERLKLAAANLQAVLKVDQSNARAVLALNLMEQNTCLSARALGEQYDFQEGFEQLLIAEKHALSGSAIRAERAALYIAQANAESALLQAFSNALSARNSTLAAEALAKLARFLPSERVNSMRSQITNAQLYGGFERGQAFNDLLTRDAQAVGIAATTADVILTGPQLRVLPIGSFVMGSPENEAGRLAAEGPQRELRLSLGFALSISEISVAQFANFVAETSYETDAERLGSSIIYDETNGRMTVLEKVNWRADYLGKSALDTMPVIHVSYNDAVEYALWLSRASGKRYRLPSEAEFEYAMRGDTHTPYWWGNAAPNLVVENLTGKNDQSESGRSWSAGFANYTDQFWGPAPVQSFLPNPFGLLDIAGNVSEWTADCWHESYARAPLDFSAWENPGCAQRVVRGGSWGSASAESRSASRAAFISTHRSAKIGFRVLREF